MAMPGRSGYAASQGGWASSGATPGLPSTLSIGNRWNNQPVEYTASQSIELTSGFESGAGDEFVAYITNGAGGSGGASSGGLATEGYRYGFNGKENDGEIDGQQDYGMRVYDRRLGRFKSVDPLTSKYAMLTPYQFASNTPVQAIDLDGLEAAITTFTFTSQHNSKVRLINSDLVVNKSKPRSETIMIVLDGQKYKANSYKTLEGRDDRIDCIGDFSGVRNISTEDVAGILGYADFVINSVYRGNVEQAVYNESNAGPGKTKAGLLDFKNRLYELFNFKQDELIAIDGIAYNANEAGNYLWGMVLEDAGVLMNPKTIAEYATRRHDEPHEQKAIQSGMNKALSWLRKNTKGPSSEIRKKMESLYTEEWSIFKSEGGGMNNYKPSDNLGVYKEVRENEK